jgi:hypothetical protein
MRVEELIELLEECDPLAVVVLSNADGTRISLLDDVVPGHYIEADSYGDFVSEEEVEEDEKINIDDSEPAVCLFSED